MHKRETFQKKAFCNSNIEKVEILHVLHNKIALEWGNILSGEQEIVTKKVLERFGPYIENVDENLYDSDEIEIKLFFFNRFFSTFWNIFGGPCTQVFYSSVWGKKWLVFIWVVKSKVIQPQPKYKTRNFLKFTSLRKRLLRDIHWNQTQIWKCYRVPLLLEGTIKWTENANWNKQKWCYCQSKNFNATSDTLRNLKTFRIITNEMPVLPLLLWWWYFRCLQMYSDNFLRLRETHNALQLPVFFFSFFLFFCQPYPEYQGIRSKKLFYRPSNS